MSRVTITETDIFGAGVRPPEITGQVVVKIKGLELVLTEAAYDRLVRFLTEARALWQESGIP